MEDKTPRYRKSDNGNFEEVKESQPQVVKVSASPPKDEAPQELSPAQAIMRAITQTPEDRMSEMTYLTKQMAFNISLQTIQNPALAINMVGEDGKVIDLPTLWEKIYFKLCRSVGGEWADMTSELARIQMAGANDDDFSLGDAQ